MKRFLPMVWVGALGLGAALPVSAGNVPQYKTTYALGETFTYLENPTLVNSTFSQHSLIFADGLEHNLRANTGEGFQIGFPFRFGGKVFTQFAIDTWGAIYLGTEEDGVVYRGQNTMLFGRNLPLDLDKADEFYLGMVQGDVWQRFKSTNKTTLNAQIGYELTGEEGERVLTVEFRNYAPKNEKQSSAGHYDLQIRLYEKDNHFELAFNEAETAKNTYGFTTGARGYEIDDAILVESSNLGHGAGLSPLKVTETLLADGKVIWDGPNDYNKYYKPVFGFYPETDATMPANAPQNLQVTQEGTVAHVSVDRAEGAPATVVLVSEKPFSDDDYPTDGETFRSQGKMGDFVTKIGDATVLYYGDVEHIEVDFDGIEASKDYYFVAISANGYPAFNTGNKASVLLSTSQAAPEKFKAKAEGQNKIALSWESDNDVIIAVTDKCSTLWQHFYEGIFGRPEADAQVGDELEGGGRVIYVGSAQEFVWEDAPANIMNYFAAWTVRDGRVSALSVEAHATTTASLPYEPMFENYPSSEVPEILDATTRQGDELGVFTRVYDQERVLRIRLSNGTPVGFYLPELNLAMGDAELTFEYAMETSRGFGEGEPSEGADDTTTTGPTVAIPLGYSPGVFGSGSLDVNLRTGANVEKLISITEYNGMMESNGDGGYQEGSSTFDVVSVPLSAYTGISSVGISASSSEFSYIYIRNVKVNGTDVMTGIKEAETDGATVIAAVNGGVEIMSATGEMVEIYSVDGRKVAGIKAPAGENLRVALPAGLYIANGKKLLVK